MLFQTLITSCSSWIDISLIHFLTSCMDLSVAVIGWCGAVKDEVVVKEEVATKGVDEVAIKDGAPTLPASDREVRGLSEA